MSELCWAGVMPAVTTPFDAKLEVDHLFLGKHCKWLIENGCSGIVALGSLGEAATLEGKEKRAVLESCVEAIGTRAPVIAGIAALSTRSAVQLAKDAQSIGCQGLMVLPPYVHKGDWREIRAHFAAVLEATELSCMLYNNPIAYGTDVLPEQIWTLAEDHANLHSVKDSSGDVRRITAIRALLGSRIAVFVGLDDYVVEAVRAGAEGWIAGLVNALPQESVRLFELAKGVGNEEVEELYRWFLPLLRLDTVPDFVQRIKLVQQEVCMGNEHVRPPRLELQGADREELLKLIHRQLETREFLTR